MTDEFSVETAFWGWLKNKKQDEPTIENFRVQLPKLIEAAGENFVDLIDDFEKLKDFAQGEFATLVGFLGDYGASILGDSSMFQMDVAMLSDEELDRLIKLLDVEGSVEIFVGLVSGFRSGGSSYYSEEQKTIQGELFIHHSSYLATAFGKLLKKAQVSGYVEIYARSDERAYESFLCFRDAKMAKCNRHNYFDNPTELSKMEKFINSKGLSVSLDELDDPQNAFVIAREDSKVFAQFNNPEVTQWIYWMAGSRGDDTLNLFVPKSFRELKFFWAVAFASNSKEQMERLVKSFIARKIGREKYPANLPKELQETYGLYVYDSQTEVAGDQPCEFDEPVMELLARLSANQMYKFAYLCAKFNIHRGLK